MKVIFLRIAIQRLLVIALIYTICRFLFLVFNFNVFKGSSFTSVAYAFLIGIRFDLSIIFLLNSLFFVLSILPFPNLLKMEGYQKFLKWIFFLVNLPFIYLNLIDLEYFMFRGKRTTAEVLGISADIQQQGFQLIFNYWYLVLIGSLLTFATIQLYPVLKKKQGEKKLPWYAYYGLLIVGLGIYFIIIRGGLQIKPIRPNQAFIFTPNVLGNLALNTPFSLLHTLERSEIKRKDFMPVDEAIKIIQGSKNEDCVQIDMKKAPNIVVIILESFSSEYTGFENPWKGYTPFLDSLSAQSVFFKHHLSNGLTSIEALPSIIASIPSLMPEPFITSMYQTNKIMGLGEILKNKGYHTSFFHGATNGSMGFDVFAKNAGFDNYFGMSEYPNGTRDFDGAWGIYDHLFLSYFNNQLSQFPQPFVSCIFTLSSHQPYSIPKSLQGKFTKGPAPIIKSIRYVDYSLQLFFEEAKKESWFSNTLFVITADHTQEKIRSRSIYNDFHVPLLFYHPLLKPKVIENKITGHTDIMPGILDFAGIKNEDALPFGHTVFDTLDHGNTLNYNWGAEKTLLFHKDFITSITEGGVIDFEPTPIPSLPINGLKPTHEKMAQYTKEIKAYVQYYNNGLIENGWVR